MPTFNNDQWQEALVSLANGAGVGGGPATIADGADVAEGPTTDAANANAVVGQLKQVNTVQGAVADTAVSNPASSGSVIALLKGIITKLAGTLTISGSVTTSGTVTEANSAAVKTDLDTIAGSISSNKMATKAASGDFADGAIATIGAQADASAAADNSTASYISLFKRLLAKFPVIGTQTSANSSSVVIASDQANVPVKGGFTEVAGVTTISASASSTGATTVAAADFIVQLDVSAYKFLGLQLSGTWAGTFTFQCSNDNATWVSLNLTSPVPSSTGYSFQTTINGMFLGPVCFRYFRVRCTTFASNASLGGVLELYTQAPPLLNSFAQIAGTWTVQPGNTQNTTPWLMAGPNANGTQAANSAANTVIKGSAGWLYHAIITTLGTAGLTIYDNATTNSGTPLLRSEEHTSELQSPDHLVCRLLL